MYSYRSYRDYWQVVQPIGASVMVLATTQNEERARQIVRALIVLDALTLVVEAIDK